MATFAAAGRGREEPSTDRSLLRRARCGSDAGWRTLVQVYGPIVYGWIRRCGVQPADAADVMQETFLAAARALSGFDPDRSGATFRGWLWTIARNKLRDRQRRESGRQGAGGSTARAAMEQFPAPALDTDEALSSADQPPSSPAEDAKAPRLRMLAILRHSYDPRSWHMFWETTAGGRDPADVAKEMNVSRWAVYKARGRILQRLRDELDGLDASD